MKTPSFAREIRPAWIVLFCTTAAFLFLPSRVRQEIVRSHAEPLVIETSKTSPPRLAFHETLDRAEPGPAAPEEIPSGSSRVDLNQTLTEGPAAVQGVKSIRYRKVVLDPMQVSRDTSLREIEERRWVEHLPGNLKKRMEIAQQRSKVMDQDWKLPSLGDLFEEKIKEVKSRTDVSPQSKVYVAALDENGRWTTPEENRKSVTVEVRKESGSKSDPHPTQTPKSEPEAAAGKILVAGHLRAGMGTLWGPGRHFEVRWFEDGVAKEIGQVNYDPSNFSYSIWVPALSGSVVARLVDETGQVHGAGKFRLSAQMKPEQLKNALIQVESRSHISSAFTSFYDQSPKQTLSALVNTRRNPSPKVLVGGTGEELEADVDGILNVAGVAEGSWTVLRAEKPGFYPGLYFARPARMKSMPLFPEKMMKALIEIVRDQRGGSGLGGETGAVIWGQVTSGTSGTAGIEVRLEGLPEVEPVYFNDLQIPDSRAKATGANGYFAFVDLPKGFYSLRAMRGAQQAGIGNVEVDVGTVSPVEISLKRSSEQTPVKVFDAFRGTVEEARVEFQHLPHALDLTGFAQIESPADDGFSLVRVTPRDSSFLETVQFMSADDDHVHLPLIRSDWFGSMRTAHKISDLPGTGALVGFVPGVNYEVSLPHLEEEGEVAVLFFDAQGVPVPKGVAGGGFIVLNAPPGSHSVTVIPEQGDALQTRLVPVDPGSVNVLKFDF